MISAEEPPNFFAKPRSRSLKADFTGWMPVGSSEATLSGPGPATWDEGADGKTQNPQLLLLAVAITLPQLAGRTQEEARAFFKTSKKKSHQLAPPLPPFKVTVGARGVVH